MNIRKRRKRSIMAILLCLALCMTLMPTAAFASSYTGEGTKTDPYMVSNWNDLKTCLTEKTSTSVYVKLQSSFSASGASEISINRMKQSLYLDLAGHKITVTGKNNQLFVVKNRTFLEIKDSAGGGGILDSSGNNQIFYVKDNGDLRIYDGKYETSSKRVIYVDDDGYGQVNNGKFTTYHKSGSALKCSSSGVIRVYGGTFDNRTSNSDIPVLDWGRELVLNDRFWPTSNEDDIVLRRVSEGILVKSTNRVYVESYDTNPMCFIDNKISQDAFDYGKSIRGREIRISKSTPVITKQPQNQSCKMGQTVTLSVQAYPATSYYWEACSVVDGKVRNVYHWSQIAFHADVNIEDNKITITPKDGWLNERMIRCEARNAFGSTKSDFAQISVTDAPAGIGTVDIALTEPVAGQKADFSYTLANSKAFAESSLIWTEMKNPPSNPYQLDLVGKKYYPGDTLIFKEGYYYGITLSFIANKKDGYYAEYFNKKTFRTNNVTLRVNGKKGDRMHYSFGNGVEKLYYAFGQPAVSVSGVSLNKTTLSLEKGMVETLNETVSPDNAANKGVTWKSGNTSVATVDQKGKVTAVGKGSAAITVTTKDGSKTASCLVTVTDPSAAVPITVAVPQAGQTASQLGKPTVTNGNVAIIDYKWTTPGRNNRSNDVDPATKIEMGKKYKLSVWLDTTEALDVTINGATPESITGKGIYLYEFTVTEGKVLSGIATVSGDLTVGGEAECTVSSLPNGAVPQYQWSIYEPEGHIRWIEISGATGPTLSLADYAEGDRIRCYIVSDGFSGYILSNEITLVKEEDPGSVMDPDNPFTDVNNGDYFKDAVLWAVKSGVTSGTGKTTFSPDGVCTRAQAVTFLWRANGSPKVSGTSPFVDVKSDDYYQQAVQWAVQERITKGTSETTFSPDEYCTRAHIVTFLHRAAGSPDASGALFSDVSDSDYFADAVRWAVSKGITQGTTAATFSPNADCTRAQIVTFIYRQMN